MSTRQLYSAIRHKNYHVANEAFSQIMQVKLAERLAQERAALCESMLQEDMSAAEVQRVFDETGDISETEILCGIRDLRLSQAGAVVSYIVEGQES